MAKTPVYFDAPPQGIKAKANKGERKAATKRKARQTPNSGATTFAKGDFTKGKIAYDHKSTVQKSFALNDAKMNEYFSQQEGIGRFHGVYCVEFSRTGRAYVIMRESTFNRLVEGESS